MTKVSRCPECGNYHILREDKAFKLALPAMAGASTATLLTVNIFNKEYRDDALVVCAIILSLIFLVVSLIDYKETNFKEKACMDCGCRWE